MKKPQVVSEFAPRDMVIVRPLRGRVILENGKQYRYPEHLPPMTFARAKGLAVEIVARAEVPTAREDRATRSYRGGFDRMLRAGQTFDRRG